MPEFMNERFPPDINYGSGFDNTFEIQVTRAAGGDEYRSQLHPYLISSLNVDFSRQRDEVIARIIDLNMRAGGAYRAFRVKHYLDYSTNNYRGTPTAFDQPMQALTANTYQIMRWYGDSSNPKCSRRRIRKPVANSVLVGVGGTIYPSSLYSVSYTTGVVTMNANKTISITAITKAGSAVVTVGAHSFAIGDSVAFSGVVGMTQINGLRALVTAFDATTITVAINSLLFGTYTSGGTVQTRPVAGEAVTSGCQFDIPMRFDSDLGGAFTTSGVLSVTGIGLIEVLNP